MQIFQCLFKGVHEQERESSTLGPPTRREEAISDHDVKGKDIILLKHHRAYYRRRTKRIKGGCNPSCKNLKISAFICVKHILKACFYCTLNVKRFGSINRRRHFTYSVKMKRDELSRGVGVTNKADSTAHVGNRVLPRTEASLSTSAQRSDQCGTTETKNQTEGNKKKSISRKKELLRWAAAARTEKVGGFNGGKVLQFRSSGPLKADPDHDDQVSSDSPKISFGWDVESSSTTSSAYSAISTSSSSKNGQSQIAQSPIFTPHEVTEHITCRKGNWITTDSEFVVLEL